ncbi:hypothetical protein MMC07_000141 [Pseudocyphellaria aurata]|nr:hypothetical protein [Pseudocyphellaria aurata]
MTTDLLAFFSKDNFSCLDFDDVALLDNAQRQAVVENMDPILAYLLAAIDYKHISRPRDIALRTELWDWTYSRLSKTIPDHAVLDFVLETSANLVEYYYPSAGHQARMCMASATVAGLLVDDFVSKPHGCEQLEAFSQRYLRGLTQPEGVCAAMAEGIKANDEFYGSTYPRAGTIAVMGWLNAVDASVEEARLAQELPCQFVSDCSRDRPTEWSVEKLAGHIRNDSAAPHAYLVHIFKPTHDGEVPSEFWMRQVGRASLFDTKDGLWTFRDTIYEACDQLINCTIALDRLFVTFAESLEEKFKATPTQAEVVGHMEETDKRSKSGQKNLENARLAAKYWGEFRQGIIAWHINTPRYQLDSLRATFGETNGHTDDYTTGLGEIASAVDAAVQEPTFI